MNVSPVSMADSSEPAERSSVLPVFVVNLAQATTRRAEIEARLQSLHVSAVFFDAVDGRQLSAQDLAAQVDRERSSAAGWSLSPSEIGCALSHIGIYRHMLEHQIPHAFILEDDVILAPDFLSLCDVNSPDCLARQFESTQPAMVQLTHVKRSYRGAETVLPGRVYRITRPFGGVWLTSGYFLTLAAARQLAQGLFPVWSVADDWSAFERAGLLSVSALTPNAVWEAASASVSSIAAGRSAHSRKKPKTVASVLRRFWRDGIVKPFFVRKNPSQG